MVERAVGARPVVGLVGFAVVPVDVVVAVDGVLANEAVHGPGRGADAVELEGQAQEEHVQVVQVVDLAGSACIIRPALEVVIGGTEPDGGEADVLVDLPAGRDAARVALHLGGAAGSIG